MRAEAISDEGLQETLVLSGEWYAVYTKHQHEKSAGELLRQKGFEVFLPLIEVRRRWKDRTKNVFLPMFPCYLFMRMKVDRKIEILQTPGVFWIVESAGRACPVPEYEIEAIRKLATARVKVEAHPYLSCGTTVRVRNGSLAGLEGILTRVKNQDRVVIAMQLLQKAVSVEVDRSNLDYVSGGERRTPPSLAPARERVA